MVNGDFDAVPSIKQFSPIVVYALHGGVVRNVVEAIADPKPLAAIATERAESKIPVSSGREGQKYAERNGRENPLVEASFTELLG